MNVANFIKWLEKQPQHLEVCVLEKQEPNEDTEGWEFNWVESICFDDPILQSRQTAMVLVLGVE